MCVSLLSLTGHLIVNVSKQCLLINNILSNKQCLFHDVKLSIKLQSLPEKQSLVPD